MLVDHILYLTVKYDGSVDCQVFLFFSNEQKHKIQRRKIYLPLLIIQSIVITAKFIFQMLTLV